jgi:hypothetical protein
MLRGTRFVASFARAFLDRASLRSRPRMPTTSTSIDSWRIKLRSHASAGVVLVSMLTCFAAAEAQGSRLDEARDVLFRAFVAEPARLAPPWVKHLYEFIAEPRSTAARPTREAGADLTPPARRHRETATARTVDRVDPYAGHAVASSEEAPLSVAHIQTESGATTVAAATPSSAAARAIVDPADPYSGAALAPITPAPTEATTMRRALTSTSVESENPYF